MKTPKVLIIGIDGATWNILDPLMENGKIPNIARLVKGGTSGNLRSTIPPVTASAWTSFQTGVNPGKHGIYDFQNFDRGSHDSSIVNRSHLPLPTIWDLLNLSGARVTTVNVPMTYPPAKAEDRVTVGGMLSPKEGDYIYPGKLETKLHQDFNYQINGGPLERRLSMDLENFIKEEIEVERKRFRSARYILKNYPSDIFMLHLPSTDGIQHCYYPFIDPELPDFSEEKYETIAKLYEAIDDEIGKFLEMADSSTTFLISDHGFRQVKTYINLNAWLKKEGYLRVSGPNLLGRAVELARQVDFLQVGKRIIGKFLDDFLSLRNITSGINASAIDWEGSKAYMPNGTIFGSISLAEDLEQGERKELEKKLANMSAPGEGEKVVEKMYRREETFQGEKTELLPDLFLKPGADYTFGVPMVMEKKAFKEAKSPSDYLGTHAMDGIFIAHGKGVKKGLNLDQTPSLSDLAPTVLALMDHEVPSYMDGEVLDSIFSSPPEYSIKEKPVPYRDREAGVDKEGDREEVEERLEDLGYL